MAKTRSATWLFCVVASARAPRAARLPAGPPGTERVRFLDLGEGLWLAVSSAPLDRFGASEIEAGLRDEAWVSQCALGHAAVIEGLAREAPVLPMKLFTLFLDDGRAVAQLSRRRKKLLRILEGVRGASEWSVRVRLDEGRLERMAWSLTGTKRPASGTAFLAGKQRARTELGRLATRARRQAARAFSILGRVSRRAKKKPPPPGPAGARLLLDAVFLVPDSAAKRFVKEARGIERTLPSEGCTATTSGPWPPYHFVET